MSATASETVTKTVTGICVEIMQDPGSPFVKFVVDGGNGKVYMSTKLQPLIELGRAAGKNLAVWTYTEKNAANKDGTPRLDPRTNEPYKDRYLQKVEIGGSIPEPDHPSPEKWADASPSRPPVLGGDKDRLIVRQVCIKAAAELTYNDEDVPLAVMKAAQRFETWIYRDMDEVPFDEGGRPPLSEHDQDLPF